MNRRYLAYAVVACVVSFGAGMLAQSATDVVSYQRGPGGSRLDIVDPNGPPAKTLVIWALGGEAARLGSRWQRVP